MGKKTGNHVAGVIKKPAQKGGAEAEVDKFGRRYFNDGEYEKWKKSPLGGKYAKIITDTVVGKKKSGLGGPSTPVDINGNPITMPGYESILNKEGGLGDAYKIGDSSPWINLQKERQVLEQRTMMDNAVKNSLSQVAGAQSGLAARGGISSGARERLAKQGVRDTNLAQNSVNLQGNINRIDLDKFGFEKDREAQQANIQTLLNDRNARMERDLAKYQADMQSWGAERTAQATAKSGKK